MLIDAALVPCGVDLRAEVLVIGAGPAGLTVAQELADAGVLVTLVEAGGQRHRHRDDDALRGVVAGEPFPLVGSRRRGFGGTSGHWTARTGLRIRPFDDIDFAPAGARPDAAWPYPIAALDDAYRRAHEILGTDGGYEPDRWFAPDASCLAWEGGPEMAMFRFVAHDVFTRRFEAVHSHPRIDLVLGGTVREIALGSDGVTVERVEVVSDDGNWFGYLPRVVVLAAGGIDNARVLLSSPGRSGAGIGNSHDNVGRYFMDHLSVDCATLHLGDGRPDPLAQFAECQDDGSGKYQPMLWLGPDRIRREGLLNAAFWVYPAHPRYVSRGVSAARSLRLGLRSRPPRGIARNLRDAVIGAPDLVRFAASRVRPSAGSRHVIGLRILAEQVPQRASRIRLGDRRDRRGLRRVELDWRIGALDLEMMHRHCLVLAELLRSRGIGMMALHLDEHGARAPIMSNFHHMGATRMDPDPRRGVVDADLRVHEVPNLFVVGGSVFPSGGYLNPTLTIVALAARLARCIRREMRPVNVGEPGR